MRAYWSQHIQATQKASYTVSCSPLGLSACVFDRVRVTQLMSKDYRMHVKERGKGVRQVGGLTNTSYANQTNETPTPPGTDPSPMGSRL